MSSKLKADAIRSMGDEQRKAALVDQARLLMDLKVQRATDRLEAISEIRVTRRNIARLKTILHEKAVKDRHAAAIKLASDEKAARIESKKAEEKAYALPAKLVVPLTMFVFPVLLVVLMLPVVISVSGVKI